jgi:hypothetical protein
MTEEEELECTHKKSEDNASDSNNAIGLTAVVVGNGKP